MKHLSHILSVVAVLAIILAASKAKGQDLPSACVGTTERYSVKGFNGHSVFSWQITDPQGETLPQESYNVMARGDSIEITWGDNLIGGAYTFTVTELTDNGCLGVPYSQQIIVNSPEIFIPISNNLLDNGLGFCFNSSISLDPGSNFQSYLWQDSTTNQVYYTGEAGTFMVRLVNSEYSCSYDSARVEMWQLPEVDLGPDTTIMVSQEITFNAYQEGIQFYNWSTGDIDQEITVSGTDGDQTIWLMVSDVHGCQNSDTVIVKTGSLDNLRIPSAFTPNGDGYNDTWVFPAPDLETGASIRDFLTDVNVEVFNRYGKLVWKSSGLPKAWDGKATNGKPLPMDSYHYVIVFKYDGKSFEYKGSVTIVR